MEQNMFRAFFVGSMPLFKMPSPEVVASFDILRQESTFEKSITDLSTSHSSQKLKGHHVISGEAGKFHKNLGVAELNALMIKFNASKGLPGPSGAQGFMTQESLEAQSSLVSSPAAPVKSDDDIQDGGDLSSDRTDSKSERPAGSMSLSEWTSALVQVFGQNEKVVEGATAMFKRMDQSKNRGFVVWGDVLDLLIEEMGPSSLNSDVKHLTHNGRFKQIQHARRETIQKVIGVSTGTTYVYIIVSKFGHVGIYDEKFRLQRKYDVDIDTDPNADLDVAASDPGWITDGLWMDNTKHAVYTTSLRTMHFYDASASVHYEEYRAFGFKSIPSCIEYFYQEDDPEGESLLIFGDDAGGLSIVTFHQPQNSLFLKDEVDNVQCLFWPDMAKHSEFCSISYSPGLHKDAVQGIKYLPHNKTVISISRDPNASAVIKHIHGKFDSYIFKLGWGIRCFDYRIISSFHVLATGSNDKLIRIWNPVVPARPSLVLTGHRVGINDIKIHDDKRLIISYDKSSVVKVWDLDQGSCFQTLTLLFPSYEVLGKEIEFGKPALYIKTGSAKVIIATCCEHMAIVTLKETPEDETESRTASALADLGATLEDQHQQMIESQHQSKIATPEPEQLMANDNNSSIPGPSQGDLVASRSMSATTSSESSVWSAVRNTVQHRARGKIFQQRELEHDSGYQQFRVFKDMKDFKEEDSLNVLRVKKYTNNSRLKELAKDNMPFMGIEIHGLEDITLDPDLPHSTNMRQRGIKIKTVDDLMEIKFDTLGIGPGAEVGAPSGFEFEETSPSSPGSRRSSTVTSSTKKTSSRKESLTVTAPGRRGSFVDPKGLPIITEKSDSQSAATEEDEDSLRE